MTAPPSTETPRHTATRPDSIYSKFHLENWTDVDFANHPSATRKTVKWLIDLESSHASLTAKVAELEAALRPFAGDKLPSARRTEIAFDRHGLRRCISLLELARDRAFAALDNADGGRGA